MLVGNGFDELSGEKASQNENKQATFCQSCRSTLWICSLKVAGCDSRVDSGKSMAACGLENAAHKPASTFYMHNSFTSSKDLLSFLEGDTRKKNWFKKKKKKTNDYTLKFLTVLIKLD